MNNARVLSAKSGASGLTFDPSGLTFDPRLIIAWLTAGDRRAAQLSHWSCAWHALDHVSLRHIRDILEAVYDGSDQRMQANVVRFCGRPSQHSDHRDLPQRVAAEEAVNGHTWHVSMGNSGSEDLRSRLQRRRRARYSGGGDDADGAASHLPAEANDEPRRSRNEDERRRTDSRNRHQRGGGGGMRSDAGQHNIRQRGDRRDDSQKQRTLSPVPVDAVPEADADDRWGFDG